MNNINKFIILIFISTLFIGCDSKNSDLDKEKLEELKRLEELKTPPIRIQSYCDTSMFEPERFEYERHCSVISHYESGEKRFFFGSLSQRYVSMVSEIIGNDTTNYFFNEGDDVKGDWFTITKDSSNLYVLMEVNRLWDERYLIIKMESKTDLKGIECYIKQYSDSKYIERDESLIKSLTGLWSIVSVYGQNGWEDVDENNLYPNMRGAVVDFLPDGTYREYDGYPDSYVEYSTYAISKRNFFIRNKSLDLFDGKLVGGYWIYNYTFYADMLKIELVNGLTDNWTLDAMIYKRIKQ